MKAAVRWASRKFLLAVASILLIVANEIVGIGIDPAAYDKIVNALIAYVAGEGIVDAVRAHGGNGGGEGL